MSRTLPFADPPELRPGALLTAGQLLQLPDTDRRYELIEGKLQMMSPGGFLHGRIAARVASLLEQHVKHHRLGAVCGAETGFLIAHDPDTVLAPDVAFVSQARLAAQEDTTGYLPLAPDLVVEVVSPQDRFSQVEQKARRWLQAGSRLVLLVDAEQKRVHVLRNPRQVTVLGPEDELDASDVVPGWRVGVREFFE